MQETKTLEQVLEELKEAEKEYKEKCLKYGITEKVKRKKKVNEEGIEILEGEETQETSEEAPQTVETNEETSEN